MVRQIMTAHEMWFLVCFLELSETFGCDDFDVGARDDGTD